jgi:pyruvate dehydrogenase E2 component (dihydrolipoamide acetyltransferase)
MPSLGADMDRGKILEWCKRVGEPIARGDIVAVVDTDKAEIEVESFTAGVLEEILVPVGETVPVGVPIARIRVPGGESLPAAAPVPVTAPPPVAAPAPSAVPAPAPPSVRPALTGPAAPAPPPAQARRPHATPLARRVAAELGVDLTQLEGTAPDGSITREDVERAAARRPAAAAAVPERAARAPESRERVASVRSAIAAAMERSNREIPHYYLATRIDLARALAWLAESNAARPIAARILPAALFVRALALAAREVPEVNGFWREGAFVPGDGVHVGLIVSLRQGGLLAPALHDADQKPLEKIMSELRDVVARARAGKLRSSEVSGATISLTNLGDQGVERVFGVIMPPQVALVGFGRVSEQPVAVAGMLAVRPTVDVTLAGDHRASDGHRGGRFLTALARRLQSPEAL